MSSTRPLVGRVVVEVDHSIAAPHAVMVLGELGAEVIRVSPVIRNSIPSAVMNDGTLSPRCDQPDREPDQRARGERHHNDRDQGQPRSMRTPDDERRRCKDLTHRQIDLAPDQH